MKYLGLVFKNLGRNKRRTILTVISIAVSLFIFSALVSLPTVANEVLSDTASSVRISVHNEAGLAYNLPMSYKQRIARTPHVEAVIAQSWFGGILHDVNDQFPNLAIDPEQIDVMWPDWGITKQVGDAFRSTRTACLVGEATMRRFNLHIGQQIMLRGTIYNFPITLNIVGVLGGKAPPAFLLFRRDYLEEAAGRPGWVGNYWVRVDKSENVPQVIATIDEGFANSSSETRSESEAAFFGGFLQGYRMLFRLAEILGLVVVLTIALVAANTAAMSIRERRGEIAIMRSMGFPPRTILTPVMGLTIVKGNEIEVSR
jgi:putative ABC transport system permease protein